MYPRALLRRFLPVAFVAAALPLRADVFNMPGSLTSLKFSNVGDPGNLGDTVSMNTAAEDQLWINGSPDTSSGYGAVAYRYAIGTCDVTVAQYVQFLNAVATTGDPYGLYNPLMGGATSGPNSSGSPATTAWSTISSNGKSWPVVCGITRTGTPGAYSYALSTSAAANLGSPPIPTSNGDFPVNWDNWGDAARFCNWLENGQPTGPEGPGTTETGSYTLSGATTTAQLWAVTRNAGATYWIPTENEWYKAAYYKSGGTNAGYWAYPTQASTSNPPSSTLSKTATNNANFGYTGTNSPNSWVLTPVGYFAGSPGPYGTYDQGGDLYDFTETAVQQSVDYTGEGLYVRVMRGGSYSKSTPIELASDYRAGADPAKYGHGRTFRLATWYTTVWNGGGSGASANNWSTAANWTGAVPTMSAGVGVAVQFGPLSGGHAADNNDLAAGTQLNGISFASGAPVYDLEGNAILLGGPVTNQSGHTQTIGLAMQLVAGGGTFNTAAGNITLTGPLSGASMSLAKSGAGTLTLAGSSTYTGGTSVTAGELVVAGSLGNTAVTVGGGATLGGTGYVHGPVVLVGGTGPATQGALDLVDGTVGTLTFSDPNAADVVLTVGGTAGSPSRLNYEVGASADRILVTSAKVAVQPGGAIIDITPLAGFGPGTFDLMDFASNQASGLGNLSLATTSLNGYTLSLRSTTTAEQLVVQGVPEPSTFALLGVGAISLAACGWWRRWRPE